MEELSQVADQRKADAVAASAACSGFINPVEAVKNPWQMLRRHADTVVSDADGYVLRRVFKANDDLATCWRVFAGIFEQIAYNLRK